MHVYIYIYFYAWIVSFNAFIVLEPKPKHTIRAYKCIISRVQYDFENLFWKEKKKGIKPLVPVPDPGLKDPPFSPGCLLPGGEPGLEGVPHRE